MLRSALLHLLLAATLASGHILITYPGSRGNNFITNETFPYGMQWTYPCKSPYILQQTQTLSPVPPSPSLSAETTWTKNRSTDNRLPGGGLSLSKNRTYWPTTGGTVAFQPGWFSGHATALLYINLGLDTDGPDGGPTNYTTIVDTWQLLGPSNGPYPGTLCIPDIEVPENLGVKAGDEATIQVVELATHGASLFAVSALASYPSFLRPRAC